jgi:hypothetical protein
MKKFYLVLLVLLVGLGAFSLTLRSQGFDMRSVFSGLYNGFPIPIKVDSSGAIYTAGGGNVTITGGNANATPVPVSGNITGSISLTRSMSGATITFNGNNSYAVSNNATTGYSDTWSGAAVEYTGISYQSNVANNIEISPEMCLVAPNPQNTSNSLCVTPDDMTDISANVTDTNYHIKAVSWPPFTLRRVRITPLTGASNSAVITLTQSGQ